MAKEKLHRDFLIGVSATAIALVSVLLTIWQGCETRKHNRLSLRPVISVDVEDECLGSRMVMWLKNDGLGPALIDSVSVRIGDTEFDHNTEWENWDLLLSMENGYGSGRFFFIHKGKVIGPKDRTELLRQKRIQPTGDYHNLEGLLSKTSVKVKYRTIYGELLEASLNFDVFNDK